MNGSEQLSLGSLGEAAAPEGSARLDGTAAPDRPAATGRPAKLDRWTAEQLAAIRADDGRVFVEAGAGSGKTGVLVERYCDAVECSDRGADAVLAFTFTEKAAGELRARVRAELRRRAAERERRGEDERARELRALARAPGAWVTTIHGFCRRLVAAHPLAAGVDPGFRVLDAAEAELLAERAFEAAFDELLAEPAAPRLALAAARRRPVLRDLVRGAHDELRSLGREHPALEEIGEPDLAGALEALAEAAREALAETAEAGGRRAPELRERIATAASLAEAQGSGRTPELDEVLGLAVSGAGFEGPATAAYNAAVAGAVERLAADLYDALRALVEIFTRRYAELKAARSGLDFEDLQLRAVALLRGSEPVRRAWSERFEEILVDEFQDTNRLQVALVEQLRGPLARLFTVGDEFQSIYGFRHADVGVFRAEREAVEPLPLSGNFRSVSGVLAAANAIGEALLPGYRPLVAAAAPPDRAVGPRDPRDPAAELLLVERSGWDAEEVGLADRGELDAPADRVAEASALARRLAELARPASEGGAGEPPGEMVVLLRAFTHVTAFEEALERAGLRPLVVGGRGYWSQQQVEDMRCLLAAVANPLEDEALLGALAGPACAASPDAQWLLRRAAGAGRHLWPTVERLFGGGPGPEREGEGGNGEEPEELERRREAAEAIPADDAERIADFVARLDLLRSRAALLPLDALVDETAGALGYDLAVLQRDRGARRWANVRKLMSLARAYEEANGRDLAGFVATLRSRAERDEREPEAQTEVEGHDGVRVMTVHNAKGLEFGLVAVADLGRELGAGGFPPAFRARPAGDGDGVRIGVRLARAGAGSLRLFELEGLQAEASAEESAEDRRLAYVAATRAERRLILSGTVDPAAAARCAGEEQPRPRTPVLYRLMAALGIGISEGALTAAGEEGAAAEGGPRGRGSAVEVRTPSLATVELPAPGAQRDRARLAVRLVSPSPGAGSALLRPAREAERRAPALPERRSILAAEPAADGQDGGDGDDVDVHGGGGDGGGGKRPGRSPRARVAAVGQLSNDALALYDRCGYRFYVERLLGLAPTGGGTLGRSLSHTESDRPSVGKEAPAFGVAVHSLLEWSARNRWLEPPRERFEQTLAGGGADHLERARELVTGWLRSPLREELASARAKLAPEAPFLIGLGGSVVRGKLDLLASPPGGPPLVVDYKTTALDGRPPAETMAPYETQRDLYALAAGPLAVRTAFVFLERPDEPVIREHDAASLEAIRARLEALVAGIAASDFEVTDAPHRALCEDCPARLRLCVHPPALTMAKAPPGAATTAGEAPAAAAGEPGAAR